MTQTTNHRTPRRPRREILSPGKLVLVGEYAVLEGAPAIVLAIDRGVRCEVHEGDGIETPDGDARFVLDALGAAPAALYRFSVWNPVNLPEKPGFGSSAAACVAACRAADRPLPDAYEIHREVQGSGSGVDVAASIHGGMIRFEGGSVDALEPILPVVIWSGRSAHTGPRVEQFLAWSRRAAFVRASQEWTSRFTVEPVATVREAYRQLVA
ncbi:MAG: hypothetical protein QGG40_18710, partial [Myxococcota bacterium]|nr:hypothetical protein [Myxococcota bacterium]